MLCFRHHHAGQLLDGVATKPPVPLKFTDDPNYSKNWATPFKLVDQTTGEQCHYSAQP